MDSLTRRHFFGRAATGCGIAALSSLLSRDLEAKPAGGLPAFPNFPPTAKRVIYLFQSGGPSQMDLFDFKPELQKRHGQTANLEQRRRSVSAGKLLGSKRTFQQYGQSGHPDH